MEPFCLTAKEMLFYPHHCVGLNGAYHMITLDLTDPRGGISDMGGGGYPSKIHSHFS